MRSTSVVPAVAAHSMSALSSAARAASAFEVWADAAHGVTNERAVNSVNRFTSTSWPCVSLPDHLHQHPLRPAAVELAVEDLLPRAEVELPLRDRDHDLPAHHLPFVVGVAVVLAGLVVVVALGARVVGGEPLEPLLVVLVQARLVVVDEDGRGDVHRVDQAQSLAHA